MEAGYCADLGQPLAGRGLDLSGGRARMPGFFILLA